MKTLSCLALFVATLALLCRQGDAFAISVDAHEEQCFFEQVASGTKLGAELPSGEGGFLDIDVSIIGPDNKVVYSGERETDGKYTFNAYMDGVYRYCFSNKMSTVTPKLVVFNMVIGTGVPEDEILKDEGEHHDKLYQMVRELSEALHNVKREQEYMEVREKTHRMINDNTNSRVVWWSFFEALVLVCMTLGQVYYLNRFFEVRTTV